MADLKSILSNLIYSAKAKTEEKIREEADELTQKAKKALNTVTTKFTFKALPKTLAELQELEEAELTDPNATVALTVLALNIYESDPEECFKMLDFLNGPNVMSPAVRDFIRDRFMDDHGYVVRSYFKGATPENNYEPKTPYTVAVLKTRESDDCLEDGYKTLYIQSGGADSERPVQLRLKPSTKQWFLNAFEAILADIRIPDEKDPWA